MLVTDLLQEQHAYVTALMERAREERNDTERVRLLGRIAEELTLHMAIEERFLYPALESVGLGEEQDQSVKEHGILRDLLGRMLELERHSPVVADTFDQIEDAVREHVQAEEQGLFPLLFTRFDREELLRFGRDMEQAIVGLRKQELLRLAERREVPQIEAAQGPEVSPEE